MSAEAKLSRGQDSDSLHSGKVVHTGTEPTGKMGQRKGGIDIEVGRVGGGKRSWISPVCLYLFNMLRNRRGNEP